MAIAIRSTGTSIETNAQTVDCPAPGTISNGDLLRLKVAVTNDINITVDDTGWTQEAHIKNTVGIDSAMALFTKISNGTQADIKVDIDGGTNFSITAQCTAFSGVDSTPMDAAATTTNDIQSTDVDGPSITTVTDEAWVESFVFGRDAGIGVPTVPTGYTFNGTFSASNHWLGSAYKEISPQNPEDPGAFVFGGVVDGGAITIAIKPEVTNPVVITDVNTTETWNDGDSGLVITGTGFI